MDFPGLIADFAARHNVAGLAAEDGAAALDIDGILVTLAETWRRRLADFRPASETAEQDLPSFGAGSFMQV